MPQHLRESDQGSTSELSEDLLDSDISEITGWIDNSELHPVAIEYGLLNMLQRPSDTQNDRIQEILDEAAEDNELGFWVDEINHILGHRQGLLDDSYRREYELRKTELSIDVLRFETLLEGNNPTALLRFVQSYLKEHPESKDKTCTTRLNII